ncbi:hypothetical protein ACHQM5_029086 [Ranunculus cassubicifolius]
MASKTFLLVLTLSCLLSASTATKLSIKPGQNLHARLNGEGGSTYTDCWNALLELKSCTNEIVLFFLNGESYLGQDCCRAIRVITRDCWPSMLTSLGFTSQEGDILQGYCDATSASPPPLQV